MSLTYRPGDLIPTILALPFEPRVIVPVPLPSDRPWGDDWFCEAIAEAFPHVPARRKAIWKLREPKPVYDGTVIFNDELIQGGNQVATIAEMVIYAPNSEHQRQLRLDWLASCLYKIATHHRYRDQPIFCQRFDASFVHGHWSVAEMMIYDHWVRAKRDVTIFGAYQTTPTTTRTVSVPFSAAPVASKTPPESVASQPHAVVKVDDGGIAREFVIYPGREQAVHAAVDAIFANYPENDRSADALAVKRDILRQESWICDDGWTYCVLPATTI